MEEKLLPPGFRFHPTDEELIAYYLTRKVTENGFVTEAIADVDLNKCDPWDLPGIATYILFDINLSNLSRCILIELQYQYILINEPCREGESGGERVVLL